MLELARFVVLIPVRAGMCSTPEDWPWSSYRMMLGQTVAPPWLRRNWLLSQFGTDPETAKQAYVDHVRAGVGLPSVWRELQGQMFLGDDEFGERMGEKVSARLSSDAEIPRLQRRAKAPPLTVFVAMRDRNSAISQAFATGCCSMKEIAQAFEIHYATVSRIIKKIDLNV